MKILKFKKMTKGKYKIYFDNGSDILLFEDVILENNLLITKEITDELLKKLIKQNDQVYVYQIAIRFISIRIRSKKEVKKYLENKNISDKLINIIIDKLEKEGYINDFKFAVLYANDQMLLSNWGPYKIKQSLVKYGICNDIVNEVIKNIEQKKVEEKLSNLISKQIKIKKGSSNSIKLKLINYFINLGYDKDMILKELSKYELTSDKNKLKKDYIKIYNKYKDKYEEDNLKYIIGQKLYSKGYTKKDISQIIIEN